MINPKSKPSIHPQLKFDMDAWVFVTLFLIGSLLLFVLWAPLGWVGLGLTAWCLYFFRDPVRVPPLKEGVVVSPADGVVCLVERVPPPAALGLSRGERTRISIFLNIFDVHVNRIPVAGSVTQRLYEPGAFLHASLDKASEDNERNTLVIQTPSGEKVIVVQIAGLIARRIRCDVEPEESVAVGQRFGIIRFGSRVDLYLPQGAETDVQVGQRMIGGETVIAHLVPHKEQDHRGAKR